MLSYALLFYLVFPRNEDSRGLGQHYVPLSTLKYVYSCGHSNLHLVSCRGKCDVKFVLYLQCSEDIMTTRLMGRKEGALERVVLLACVLTLASR